MSKPIICETCGNPFSRWYPGKVENGVARHGDDAGCPAYNCPCGWSRIRLDGETLDDARRAHELTDVHRLALDEDRPHHYRPTREGVCDKCGRAPKSHKAMDAKADALYER